jgi:hypothetical protein
MNPRPSCPSRRPGPRRPHRRRPKDDLRGGGAVITDEKYKVQLPRVDGGRRPVACGGSTRRRRRTRMRTSTPMPSLPPPRQCSTRKGGGGAAPPPPPPSRRRGPCRLTTPATRHAPPRPLVGLVVVLHHLTPPPLICRHLSLWHHLLCLSSVRLVVPSPRFSRCHLPSASAPASHRHPAIASCHAPLRPLIRLVKASPLLTPPPPICGIIESSQRSSLMLV